MIPQLVPPAAAALLLGVGPVLAQTGVIAGTVVDQDGAPVTHADIVVVDQALGAPAGPGGRFVINGVSSGRTTVMARAVGFHFSFATVHVPPGDTGWVVIRMRAMPTRLAPVETTVAAEDLLLPDFARRRRAGFGYFVSGEEIAAADPISLSQFLPRFPTIRIMDSLGVPQAVSRRGPKVVASGAAMIVVPCVMRVALDGQLLPAGTTLDIVPPATLGGIEIYPGPSTIPAEFAAMSRDVGCGLIALWTRRR